MSLIFGIFPFIATILLSLMREDSPPFQLWFSIVRLLMHPLCLLDSIDNLDPIGLW